MTATLTIDATGTLILPDAANRLFGIKPGVRVRAEVSADRIEIVKEVPVVSKTTRSPSGRLVLASTGVQMDAAKAVRGEQDQLSERASKR